MKKKVFVGISGGVDSSVAAHLLLQQGFDVTGVFMKNWSGEDYGIEDQCPWKEDLKTANEAAQHLGIPLKVYNFEKEYREAVIKDFFYQYSIGNTPNPDVLCNKFIKFNEFLKRAVNEGADYIATGHYSKTFSGQLFKAKDKNKDQTYFLHQLTKDQLEKSLFPLGDLIKPQVREIAIEIGLPNAKRKDSQGICFIGKIDLKEFLSMELKEKKGDVIDLESNSKVGIHSGIWFYTIGQRHGLGIGGSDIPYFVAKKDVEKNILYVVKGSENKNLYSKTLILDNFNQISPITSNNKLTAQVRYRGSLYNIKSISKDKDLFKIEFEDPAWAVALGQSVVVYEGEQCLGGGTVKKIID